MKKVIAMLILMIILCFLSSCSISNESLDNSVIETQNSTIQENVIKEDNMDKNLVLKINDILVDVVWEDNVSVAALKNLAKNGISINMSKYGGFEQVGSIGTLLPSNDRRITANSGDIVLYSSNQIVIFYDSNTWTYTNLGHIDLSKNELAALLDVNNVTISISLK